MRLLFGELNSSQSRLLQFIQSINRWHTSLLSVFVYKKLNMPWILTSSSPKCNLHFSPPNYVFSRQNGYEWNGNCLQRRREHPCRRSYIWIHRLLFMMREFCVYRHYCSLAVFVPVPHSSCYPLLRCKSLGSARIMKMTRWLLWQLFARSHTMLMRACRCEKKKNVFFSFYVNEGKRVS